MIGVWMHEVFQFLVWLFRVTARGACVYWADVDDDDVSLAHIYTGLSNDCYYRVLLSKLNT